ncbi:MAG TPA: hypothetical protein VNO30_06590 [Kofleriaceae bacterium]|nr:hypothetical protein [Kofleriaceae bacterium]
MTSRPAKPQRSRERDLKEVLARLRRADAEVADALVTVLRCADTRTLVALGVIFEFVTQQLRRRAR